MDYKFICPNTECSDVYLDVRYDKERGIEADCKCCGLVYDIEELFNLREMESKYVAEISTLREYIRTLEGNARCISAMEEKIATLRKSIRDKDELIEMIMANVDKYTITMREANSVIAKLQNRWDFCEED